MTDAYMDWMLVRDENKLLFVERVCQTSEGTWVIDVFTGLKKQFSICYNLFLAILNNVELRVMKELSCSDPDWQLKNSCAACTFELEGKEELEFHMLGAMDGNDSLKRVPHSKAMLTLEGDRISNERDNLHDGGGEYILPRVEVNRRSKEAIGDMDVAKAENMSPCQEQWKNILDDCTSKMWGVFEETGFFLSLCRHGSVLVGADMVKSGEQVKYPLAVIMRLLQTFGDHLGIGYNIGCKFGGTVHRSPLGELARMKQFCMLVGLFHGHAHNHLCQFQHLGTYVKGLGLEDLETLEHFFSKSNALAGVIRYASRFHHHQHINSYLKHIDRSDSFEHLTLEIIDSYPALQKSMWELGVTNEKEFKAWLQEEEDYLSNLQYELPKETIEMEYFARLVHYYDVESKVTASNRVIFIDATNGTHLQSQDDTHKMETARRHLLKKRSQELERVQDLERSLNIFPEEQWIVGSEKWRENEQRVAMRMYQHCLDRLEGLVVAHIFELTKMNMSHTADFDLLRDVCQDMSDRKWATPAGHQAMDTYFKICRAKEEIKHLNIEIQQVITYMHIEDVHLHQREAAIADMDAALALQIAAYHKG
ncbi:hypothetical protein EDD18DRAFT_1310535 [Armillaria luteobubalina]|uniref:CxC2-like cysteine cluster KDZ transposase-associated domain-containing protein n=1 Tax=Armillaria luteobubalina TaxID=153913 RepID=A0AA39UM30_9AGAR|nr:hypothetical protein EDD18DRAFT_1310535 [Armillaria luteobubalina]